MMRKKILTILIGLCVCLAVGCLTGCSGRTPDHYDYLVTFNYNTAHLESGDTYADQYLGAMDGQRIMQPVKASNPLYANSDFKELQLTAYEVTGWYTAKTDGEGNVLKNEDGSVMLDRQWNFRTDRVTENITLYAQLAVKPKLTLIYNGEVMKESRYITGNAVRETSFMPLTPKLQNHTFYGYYADEDLTERFTFPFIMGEEDVTIYARFIEGENWKIVATAQEFAKAYSSSAKIYIDSEMLDDNKVLDFTGVAFTPMLEFGGEINGNGAVLQNIECTITPVTIQSTVNLGLFGKLTGSANIHDITFADVKITVHTLSPVPVRAALFAHTIEKGVKLSNVTVTGTIQNDATGNASLVGFCVSGEENAQITACDFSGIIVKEENNTVNVEE